MPIVLSLLLLLTGLCSSSAWAEIYTFRDSNGVAHYSDNPNDPRSRVVKRVDFTQTFRSTKGYFVDVARRQKFAGLIETAAHSCPLKPALIHAVVTVESGYQPQAVSKAGAVGLMQLMPDTARQYGVTNRHDPEQNLRGGARYLCDLLNQYSNDLALTLAAYNAGPGAVSRYKGIPPYEETRNYVVLVLEYYQRYRNSF